MTTAFVCKIKTFKFNVIRSFLLHLNPWKLSSERHIKLYKNFINSTEYPCTSDLCSNESNCKYLLLPAFATLTNLAAFTSYSENRRQMFAVYFGYHD